MITTSPEGTRMSRRSVYPALVGLGALLALTAMPVRAEDDEVFEDEIVRISSESEPPGVGVRFVNVSYESQELIDALVSAGMREDEG